MQRILLYGNNAIIKIDTTDEEIFHGRINTNDETIYEDERGIQ